MEIRAATISDLEKIQSMNQLLFEKEDKEFDYHLNMDWTSSKDAVDYYKKRLSGDGCAFVIEIDGSIIGYVLGGLCKFESYRTVEKVAELENMFVYEEYRRQGVGKKLYDAFLAWAKEQKVNMLRVQATSQNKAAINFYRKCGFKDYTLILEKEV